jgi:SpoVK/Ycf46/Vps4 family AAA+-type ATPase
MLQFIKDYFLMNKPVEKNISFIDSNESIENSDNKNTESKTTTKIQTTYSSQNTTLEIEKDVVLSDETKQHFDECLAKIKFHRKIYDEWEFAKVDPLGRTVILNFFGPPGTGKTLAAKAFAGTLGMPIIEISIADLESKYMGETAKNIQLVFKQAYEQSGVLFFDEADTLLGKRLSSVTQGIDNEVNSMRTTLLIELERFDGIVIFATNFAKNYDEAFRSRITHHIKFTLPDLAARTLLWQKMLLSTIPSEQAHSELAILCAEQSEGLSGREIRTCMRLALPKVLVEAEKDELPPMLKIKHLFSAISQVKTSINEVANNTLATPLEIEKSRTAKNMLGI